jgi:hypothetical protein
MSDEYWITYLSTPQCETYEKYLERGCEQRDKRIAELEAQVARMPVLAGFIDDNIYEALMHIDGYMIIDGYVESRADKRHVHPIYIDPSDSGEE